jgi:hypothetical protein
MEFLALIQQSGFENAELMAETGFNSSLTARQRQKVY